MLLKRTAFLLILTPLLGGALLAQAGQTLPAGIPQRQSRIPGTTTDDQEAEARDRITRDMAKKANAERQVALRNDAEKLLKLATELKASVDKSNENVLSLDVLKKAEEIEKLARSVKDKMKGPN